MCEKFSFDQLRQDLMQLYGAGDYAAALNLVNAQAASFPDQSARIAFWKICLLSLEGRLEEALSTFRQGLDNGLWWAESQFIDTDLDPLRDLPAFKELVRESVRRWDQERRQIKREHLLLLPDAQVPAPYPLLVVLHGRNGDKESNMEHWEAARGLGWAILSVQSTQPLFPGDYCWDDAEQGIRDINCYLEEIMESNLLDRERLVIGGFSQGSGMAIYAALGKKIPVQGFIAGASWWQDVESLAALAVNAKDVKGYFVTGGKDHTLARAREIQAVLKENNVSFAEDFHPELGHEFPAGFGRSLERAFEFILGLTQFAKRYRK